MLQIQVRRDKPVAILLGIIFFLSGIYSLMRPEFTIFAISVFIGVLLIIKGVTTVIAYFVRKRRYMKELRLMMKENKQLPEKVYEGNSTKALVERKPSPEKITKKQREQMEHDFNWQDSMRFAYGIILILLGILLVLRLEFTAVLVTYLISFWFIIDAILGFIYGIRNKGTLAMIFLFLSLLLLAAGLLLLFGQDAMILPPYIIVGVALIADGIQTGMAPFARV